MPKLVPRRSCFSQFTDHQLEELEDYLIGYAQRRSEHLSLPVNTLEIVMQETEQVAETALQPRDTPLVFSAIKSLRAYCRKAIWRRLIDESHRYAKEEIERLGVPVDDVREYEKELRQRYHSDAPDNGRPRRLGPGSIEVARRIAAQRLPPNDDEHPSPLDEILGAEAAKQPVNSIGEVLSEHLSLEELERLYIYLRLTRLAVQTFRTGSKKTGQLFISSSEVERLTGIEQKTVDADKKKFKRLLKAKYGSFRRSPWQSAR